MVRKERDRAPLYTNFTDCTNFTNFFPNRYAIPCTAFSARAQIIVLKALEQRAAVAFDNADRGVERSGRPPLQIPGYRQPFSVGSVVASPLPHPRLISWIATRFCAPHFQIAPIYINIAGTLTAKRFARQRILRIVEKISQSGGLCSCIMDNFSEFCENYSLKLSEFCEK